MVLTDSKWKIGNLIGNDKNMTNLAISATQFETYFIDVYYCTLQECKVLFFTLIHIELQYDRQCGNYKSMTCTRYVKFMVIKIPLILLPLLQFVKSRDLQRAVSFLLPSNDGYYVSLTHYSQI